MSMKESKPTVNKAKISARKQREQARARAQARTRYIWIGIGALIVIALGAVIYFAVATPPPPPIEGLETFPNIPGGQHVTGAIPYDQVPPVGGPHDPVWQNCGIYTTAIRSENGVHSMEHGAVWITYQPDLPADQITALQNALRGQPYLLLSPFADLPAPVVASAWGAQVKLTGASDPRLAQFVSRWRNGAYTPERGAPCTGGLGTPNG